MYLSKALKGYARTEKILKLGSTKICNDTTARDLNKYSSKTQQGYCREPNKICRNIAAKNTFLSSPVRLNKDMQGSHCKIP